MSKREAKPIRRGGLAHRGRGAAHTLPILAALVSLGFEHTEAGILRDPPVTSTVARATKGELALRTSGLRRTASIRHYASRYEIGWELSAQIHDAAAQAGIHFDLAYRLVRVESSFKRRAIGPAGAIGFTQVQPATAHWLDPGVTREDLFEVETNLRVGFSYLRMLIDRYGSTRLALLAYNRGPGTVHTALVAGEDPANGYAARVLGARSH